MRKKLNRSQLTKKLDKAFSKYVRLSRSEDGYCKCITCPALKPPAEMHAGHFIRRGVKTTRWDERNVQPQCPRCNVYCYGEQAKYFRALEAKYGRETVDELMQLERDYRAGNYQKLPLPDMREMVEDYKEKVKNLKDQL